MTGLSTRGKEFLNLLKQEHDAQFNKGLPKITLANMNLTKKALKDLKLNERDRDVFQLFHNNVVLPEFEVPECQCSVVEEAFTYV